MVKLDKEGEFNSTQIAKGVYASLGKIIEVLDLSNHPDYDRNQNLRKDGTPLELCIEVKYQRDDGKEWTSRFWGGYKKDDVTGNITGWNAFRNGVQGFFETMLGDLNAVGNLIAENWAMTQALLDSVKGKEFYRISYISGIKPDGKGRYRDWNKIFLKDTTVEKMQEEWARVAIKLNSYTPEAIDEINRGKESFQYGSNAEQAEKTGEEFEL